MRAVVAKQSLVWLSLLGGLALWEIVGRNTSPAFLVPLSATLKSLFEMVSSGELVAATESSLLLFFTGDDHARRRERQHTAR